VQNSEAHWQRLYDLMYGDVTAVQHDAAVLAGGWKQLYGARHLVMMEVAPWEKACQFEINAAGTLKGGAQRNRQPPLS